MCMVSRSSADLRRLGPAGKWPPSPPWPKSPWQLKQPPRSFQTWRPALICSSVGAAGSEEAAAEVSCAMAEVMEPPATGARQRAAIVAAVRRARGRENVVVIDDSGVFFI